MSSATVLAKLKVVRAVAAHKSCRGLICKGPFLNSVFTLVLAGAGHRSAATGHPDLRGRAAADFLPDRIFVLLLQAVVASDSAGGETAEKKLLSAKDVLEYIQQLLHKSIASVKARLARKRAQSSRDEGKSFAGDDDESAQSLLSETCRCLHTLCRNGERAKRCVLQSMHTHKYTWFFFLYPPSLSCLTMSSFQIPQGLDSTAICRNHTACKSKY